MSAARNLVLQLLITGKDLASAPIRGIVASVKFLDSEISVVAGKIRSAFSGLFGGGVDSAIDFEAALARVKAKSGASEEELAKLKKAALEWARNIGLGADGAIKAAQALEFLTGAGLSADQAISALGPTLRVAKNEQISAEIAAKALTDTMAVMGLQYDEAARAGDVLQKSADLTSTSVSALAEAIRNGGGAAVKSGLTFEQTVTILTAFAKAGIQGSEAGTALAAVLGDITDPASKARQELAKFGESTGDVSAFIGKLVELGPRGIQVVRAFSDTAGPGLAALLKTGTAGLQEYGRAIEKDAVGGLEKASNTIDTTTRGALDRLASAWAQIKITLAGPLLKPIADGAELLGKKLGELESSGVLQQIGEGISKLYVDAGRYVEDFLKKVDWGKLKTEAGNAIAYVRTALDETIGGVQGKIQTVSDWTTTVFSPLTQAVDGYRLAWAVANKDQAEAARLQAQIEARTAAIGRALAGTSGATREYGQQTGQAAQSTEALQTAAQDTAAKIGALGEALKAQQAEVDRLAAANAKGQASSEEYGAAVIELWGLQAQLKAAQQDAAAGQERVNNATEQAVPATERHAEALKKTWAEIDAASIAALNYQENLSEVDRQIKAASTNAGDWREGLKLTGVQMFGLKETAAALADKLALVEEAQRRGLATDKDVQPVKKAAADAQDRYNKALDAYVVQQERALAAVQRANDLDQKSYDLKIQKKQAEADLARIKGDLVAAEKAEAEITDLLIEQAEKNAANKQKEIDAYRENIEAVRQKLLADGELSAADQDQLAIMDDKLKALDLEKQSLKETAESVSDKADAEKKLAAAARAAAEDQTRAIAAAKDRAEQLQAQGEAVTGTLNGWLDRLKALSPAAVQAFETQQKFAQSTADTADAGQKAAEALDALGQTMTHLGGTGFARQMNETAAGAQRVEATFWGQAEAAERVTAQLATLAETGAGNFGALIDEATAAKASFDLLDQSRLDNLQSAIDAANSKLREMQDEAQSAADRIAELNAEIAAEKGDTAAADKLKLELEQKQALAEIDAKLAEAQRAQNRDLIALYEEQKRKLQELYDLRERNLEQDQRQQKQQTENSRGGTSSGGGGSSGSSGSSAGAAKVYQLNLVGAGGKTLTATTDSDPNEFLDALEAAKNRSLR